MTLGDPVPFGFELIRVPIKRILEPVKNYYTEKVKTHGPVARGMDWNSRESQELRFDQLLKVLNARSGPSICDYGCGSGKLFDYLRKKNFSLPYTGIDISPEMIRVARRTHRSFPSTLFRVGRRPPKRVDFAVASGIFNVKLKVPRKTWKKYILDTLETMNRFSEKGFAFNCLTKYSDKDRMRKDLYYADPCFLFDYCKRSFSKNIALLHDYGLYEFTILIRKDTGGL